jgi:hypothetical protein
VSKEIEIVRRVQARDGMAFDKLLAGFQRKVLQEPVATSSFQGMYSCFDQYSLTPHLEIHEQRSRLVDDLFGAVFDAGPDVGNARRPKAPEYHLSSVQNGKRQTTRRKAASYCYGIVVTPERVPQGGAGPVAAGNPGYKRTDPEDPHRLAYVT